MSEFNTVLQKVTVTCTDNGRQVTATIDSYKKSDYMTVIMANQKINLQS